MPGVPLKPGEQQPYLMTLDQAVELALIDSREYQDAREALYLAALPVTLQRFSFAAQFFAGGEILREWAGRLSPGGGQNNWQANSNVGVAKLFSTGALLLFNFANQTVFNLGGSSKPVTSESTIDLSLVQPLLQGAGTAVNLEPLTQAERNLLYQIRTFARFRKSLYVAIAGGGGGSITGATFQPVGVLSPGTAGNLGVSSASSGLIPGLIPAPPLSGNPGLQVSPGPSGFASLQTSLAAPVSGYLTTLLNATQMQVDKYNIEKLQSFLALGRALQEGGDISQLQTDQFEQSLLGGRSRLLTDQQQYLQSLDQFKLQLGIPTYIPMELDDSPFRPLNAQFARFEDVFRQFNDASKALDPFGLPSRVSEVRRELLNVMTSSELTRGTRFGAQIQARLQAWQKLTDQELLDRQKALGDERRNLLNKRADLEQKGQILSAQEEQRLADAERELDLAALETQLRTYESQPWNKLTTPALRDNAQRKQFGYLKNQFVFVLIDARNERMGGLRTLWPNLSRLCLEGTDLLEGDLDQAMARAAQYALLHRLDLMNARAQLVDAWRQVAIFANALLAPVNVEYSLTSNTPPGAAMPLNFSASRTQQQLLLNFQLPLVRVAQRNNYRVALINLQRARRVLQRAEDEAAYDVRQEIIQLRELLENYRIQSRQVELGYFTVENAQESLQAPSAPGVNVDVATRAASLTQQLISTQSNLYNAQFTMTTTWITYLNTRLQLYRDLELMPLDNRGVWIDENATDCSASGRTGIGDCGAGNQRQERLPEPQPNAPTPAPTPK
jgi:hypothetical protein